MGLEKVFCWDTNHFQWFLSSFTHPHIIPNLYSFLSPVKHKRTYFEERICNFSVHTVKVSVVQCCFGPSDFHYMDKKRAWWSILLLAVLGMRGQRGQGMCWRDVATAGRLSLLMISPVDGSGALQRYRRLDIIQRAEQRQESVLAEVGFLHQSKINSAVGRCPWSRIN